MNVAEIARYECHGEGVKCRTARTLCPAHANPRQIAQPLTEELADFLAVRYSIRDRWKQCRSHRGGDTVHPERERDFVESIGEPQLNRLRKRANRVLRDSQKRREKPIVTGGDHSSVTERQKFLVLKTENRCDATVANQATWGNGTARLSGLEEQWDSRTLCNSLETTISAAAESRSTKPQSCPASATGPYRNAISEAAVGADALAIVPPTVSVGRSHGGRTTPEAAAGPDDRCVFRQILVGAAKRFRIRCLRVRSVRRYQRRADVQRRGRAVQRSYQNCRERCALGDTCGPVERAAKSWGSPSAQGTVRRTPTSPPRSGWP